VRPKIVVISCGKNNKYGHPHTETLNRLKGTGAKILRTDEMGTIVIRTDGKNVDISKLVD
jgi:competence protein ComEC